MLCIYLSGTFHISVYEVVHLCMHLGDIVSLDYVPHTHDIADETSVSEHDHGQILHQLDSDANNQGDSQIPTLDENPKHEIAQSQLRPIIQLYCRKYYRYQQFNTIQYQETSLPPPKKLMSI